MSNVQIPANSSTSCVLHGGPRCWGKTTLAGAGKRLAPATTKAAK